MGAAQAQIDIWRYVLGFTEMAVVKCAIELGIADVLETQEGPMTLDDLSSSLGCSPSALYRIMRFLTYRGIFKEVAATSYAQTPISRLLMRDGERSMAALVLLQSSPVMLEPWHGLRARVLANGPPAFEAAHGDDVWRYAERNPAHSKLFNDAMACDARVAVSATIDGCPEVFKGISSLVDVGGGDGTALGNLIKACPWIRGINFDLPHVVSVAPHRCGVEHVGGDMFKSVPKADAAFLMAVIDGGGEDKLKDVGLMLDMAIMAHTTRGKERTAKEWAYVLSEAGFSRHTVKRIRSVKSVIEAYP